MPTSSETYWNIKRLNRLFAAAAVLLVVVLIWAIGDDYDRPWRIHQRSARVWEAALLRDRLDRALALPAATEPSQSLEMARMQRKLAALEPQSFLATVGNRLRSAPLLQFINSSEQVRQVVVKDVLTDRSFAKVETIDRCTSCHVNVDRPEFSQQRVIEYLESQLAAEGHAADGSATAGLEFWRAWGAKLLPAAEQRRLRTLEDTREAIRARLGADEYRRLEDRYRHALVDELNSRRRERGEKPLDPSPLMLAHPRLDLFLGTDSPHKLEEIGCTGCHDGSGQETDFALAAHTPRRTWVDRETGQPVLDQQIEASKNEPTTYVDPAKGQSGIAIRQSDFWRKHHAGGARSDWDRPMLQAGYLQSACARCHGNIHDIRDEAPLLHEGRSLFSRLGCANCHSMDSIPAEEKGRVGPDLRHVASKLSPAFMQGWIWEPREFRPGTKMPHFFKLENNFTAEDVQRTRDEVRAITAYLIKASTPVPSGASMPRVSEEPQQVQARITRGRALFIGLRDAQVAISDKQGGIGCIGCHTNSNETGTTIAASFSPDLSAMGTKLLHGDRPKAEGRRWLAQWLMEPRLHSPATRMPSLRLSAQEAMDLAEYLLAEEGRPPAMPGEAAVDADVDLGRKLIIHYGCASCHAIDGLESTPGPGPNLSAWGQKRVDQLAFGQLSAEIEPTRTAWMEQKLRNPRIYDRGQNLPAAQKLRMPKFELGDGQIQALVTFVTSNRDRMISSGLLAKVNGVESQAIARGRQIAERYNCIGCHAIDGPEPIIQQYWSKGYYDEVDLATKAPPSLRGEGSRIQHEWLYNYLKRVDREGINGRIRPLPSIRMPGFALSDDETKSLVAYFSAVAQREASLLTRRLEPLLRGKTWPEDNWYRDPKYVGLAEFLKDWALANTPQKPVDFAARNSAESLALAYKTALYDARFIMGLYDAPYPFIERSQPILTGQQFAKGEAFYHQMQCQTCHVLGDERDGRVNPSPRGPNLSLTHRRLQRAWVRHWLQETQVIRADAVMPSFFSGRAVASPLEPNKTLFELRGLPYMLPPLTAEQIRQIQATYGVTVEQQAELLLDFLYAAGLRAYTSPDPSSDKPARIGNN